MEVKHMYDMNQYKCHFKDCGKVFSWKASLKSHIRSVHLAPTDERFKWTCTTCGSKHNNNMAAYRCCKNKKNDDNEDQ